MNKINAYRYDELTVAESWEIKKDIVNNIINWDIEDLNNMLQAKTITMDTYCKEFGQTEYYLKVTPWFMGACYYEQHQDDIEKRAMDIAKNYLYTRDANKRITPYKT